MNRCIFSLGSNVDGAYHIEQASQMLDQIYPHIYWAEPVWTEPVGNISHQALFLNRIAIVYTDQGIEDIRDQLKMIEQRSGRNPDDKVLGKIVIDIDLLLWNDCELKPEELHRDYVLDSIRFIVGQHGV